MKPVQVTAEPTADGRVSLSWITPPETTFRGVRVLRRVRRFPDLADLGTDFEIYRDGSPLLNTPRGFVDGPLLGETVYYYAVVAFDSSDRKFPVFVSAMTVVPYRSADYLYRNLPEIYQLYDKTAPSTAPTPADSGKGPLARFLELTAQPLDLVRSLTSAMQRFHDVERVDGALLPLLSQWIGQPSDVTLNLERQRNEVRYAPPYYRTAGIPANLRASVNRFTNWDAHIKEFANNVFLATYPEQLTIQEIDRVASTWQPPVSVNLDIAYEGRVAPLLTAGGRAWLFYHARRQGSSAEEWHIFAKVSEQGQFLPSFRLTTGTDPRKHPAAVQRPDGTVWLFYGRYASDGVREVPAIGLQVLSTGRPTLPARITGTLAEPFALVDGDTFQITVAGAGDPVVRLITIRAERFDNLLAVPAAALAHVLDAEIPGAEVTAVNGNIVFTTAITGALATLTVGASTVATKIGILPGPVIGADATPAQLTGGAGPFTLADQDTLTLKIDADSPRTIVFSAASFANIATATASELAAEIERQAPGVATVAGGTLQLSAASLVSVLVNESTAAGKLGFGVAPPPSPSHADEDEPSACVDGAGNIWLFWASRRNGSWQIWYNRYDGSAWGAPKALTAQPQPDREPFVLFDAAGGRLWVFWSRRKDNGLWNVFSRTTTNLNFATLAEANWTEQENLPGPADFNNREPAASLAPTGEVELYFASDRADGWNTWTRTLTPLVQNAESAATTGPATRRAPAPLRVSATQLKLFTRTNDGITYTSTVYPLAQTLDFRYSGATTADVRNPSKLSLRGNIRDLQRYTYDARHAEDPGAAPSDAFQIPPGIYARDSAGVYLTPDTDDQQLILLQRRLFTNALQRFIPIQVRLTFLVDRVTTDSIYTYDSPSVTPQVVIGEQMVDTILPEVLPIAADGFEDIAHAVRFLRTWAPGESATLPDLSVSPPNLNIRLFTSDFNEGP